MGGEPLLIVKIGGAVIDDPEMLTSFLEKFKALEGQKILIHGGGRIATDIGAKQGIVANMVEGRRVTDDQTIDLVTMVYGGLVNKQMTSKLQKLGINAMGLTGIDGDIIRSQKRPVKNGVDYGWVGDPVEVNEVVLTSLLQSHVVPVIAPLTHDGNGHILNTNADTMAGAVASALAKQFDVTLILTFELEGVMKDVSDLNSLIPIFKESSFNEMKNSGAIHSGMIPKLENAFYALNQGVTTARICKYDQIDTKNGTFLQI